MTGEEHDQLRADLGSMLRLLGPILLLAVVLALNIVMHHDTYVGHVHDAYIAPVITAPPLTSTNTAFVPSLEVAKAEHPIWDELADCESGDHVTLSDGTWQMVAGSARWHIANRLHQGGLQFAANTWDAFRPAGYPEDAQMASRAQQIAVGERVLEVQGPGAWPTCGPKVGLHR